MKKLTRFLMVVMMVIFMTSTAIAAEIDAEAETIQDTQAPLAAEEPAPEIPTEAPTEAPSEPESAAPTEEVTASEISDATLPSEELKITVIYSEDELHYGDLVKLIAEIDADTTIVWQVSTDNGITWKDIENENGKQLEIVVTKENETNLWRACAEK